MEVNNPNLGKALTQSVDTTNPLFDAHGVPGQVVIDQRATELEIQSLGSRIRAKKDLSLSTREAPTHIVPRYLSPPPGTAGNLAPAPGKAEDSQVGCLNQLVANEVQSICELREYHHLAVASVSQLSKHTTQGYRLCVFGQSIDLPQKILNG